MAKIWLMPMISSNAIAIETINSTRVKPPRARKANRWRPRAGAGAKPGFVDFKAMLIHLHDRCVNGDVLRRTFESALRCVPISAANQQDGGVVQQVTPHLAARQPLPGRQLKLVVAKGIPQPQHASVH